MTRLLFIALMLFTLTGCSSYSSSSGYSSTSHGNIRQSTSYYSPYDRTYNSSYSSPYATYAPRRAYAFPYSNVGRYNRHGFNRYAYRSPRHYSTTRRSYGNRHYRHQKRHHRKHKNHRSYNSHHKHRNHRHNNRHHKRMNRDRQHLIKQFSNSSLRHRFK